MSLPIGEQSTIIPSFFAPVDAFWTEQSFIYIGSVPLAVEVSQYHNCCDLNGVMLMLLPVACPTEEACRKEV